MCGISCLRVRSQQVSPVRISNQSSPSVIWSGGGRGHSHGRLTGLGGREIISDMDLQAIMSRLNQENETLLKSSPFDLLLNTYGQSYRDVHLVD